MSFYSVYLKKGEERRILDGHPWVYANEVSKVEGKSTNGSIAKVFTFDGRFIGQGFINHLSKILVRMLTFSGEEIGREFFFKRINAAVMQRKALGFSDNFRAVFSESDTLSGLVVDKYGEVLSVQFLSLGMDLRKDMIVDILVEIFKPACVYERSDVAVRTKEGLSEKKGALYGTMPKEVFIEENGLRLKIDVENGQKTGYFLDQKFNRANLKSYAKDRKVLDLFCNQGGFSLCAAFFGAKQVLAVDISPTALQAVKENAKINNLKIETVEADVFDYLRELKKSGEAFDLIILDPPAFTKSVDTVKEGLKGYCDLNTLCLKLLSSGGILVTCSCSQHVTVPLFLDMLKESSKRAAVPTKLLEFRTQSLDHAPLLSLDEGLYLKCAVLLKV